MPRYMKIIITGLVLVAAIVMHFYQASIGQRVDQWLVLFLGGFMVFALWLFPDAKKAPASSKP